MKRIFMKDVDLILGDEATGDNFKCQLKSVALTPETNTVKSKSLCPDGQRAEMEDPEWTLSLGYFEEEAEATDTVEALGDYLFENHGDKVPFLFRPMSGGRGWSGTVTLQAGGTGGEQGNFSEQSVELPLDGQPTRVAAVVVP